MRFSVRGFPKGPISYIFFPSLVVWLVCEKEKYVPAAVIECFISVGRFDINLKLDNVSKNLSPSCQTYSFELGCNSNMFFNSDWTLNFNIMQCSS